jgi:hypothetical protein
LAKITGSIAAATAKYTCIFAPYHDITAAVVVALAFAGVASMPTGARRALGRWQAMIVGVREAQLVEARLIRGRC